MSDMPKTMLYGGRLLALATGLILAGAGSAWTQQIGSFAIVPMEKSVAVAPPPLLSGPAVAPLPSPPPSKAVPADRLIADTHVDSTELGFDKGIAPAPGRKISFKGRQFQVANVAAKGGGPTFAGGSQFVIGVNGSTLIVGLATIVPAAAATTN